MRRRKTEPTKGAVMEQLLDVIARLEQVIEHVTEHGEPRLINQPRETPPTEQGC